VHDRGRETRAPCSLSRTLRVWGYEEFVLSFKTRSSGRLWRLVWRPSRSYDLTHSEAGEHESWTERRRPSVEAAGCLRLGYNFPSCDSQTQHVLVLVLRTTLCEPSFCVPETDACLSRLEGELPHHSSYFSHASLLTCTTQKVVEPLIFVNMDLEYRQFKLLVRYLYTCDPLIAHPTHRTICLSITGLSTPPLGSDRYDLSSLFTFMPNLQFLYAPSVLSRSQELVGIAYHSHLSRTELSIRIDETNKDCLLATSSLARLGSLRQLDITFDSDSGESFDNAHNLFSFWGAFG
jgi:hypothetical protein